MKSAAPALPFKEFVAAISKGWVKSKTFRAPVCPLSMSKQEHAKQAEQAHQEEDQGKKLHKEAEQGDKDKEAEQGHQEEDQGYAGCRLRTGPRRSGPGSRYRKRPAEQDGGRKKGAP